MNKQDNTKWTKLGILTACFMMGAALYSIYVMFPNA